MIAIGGGLAGAAFAVELARNGAPVSVLEGTRGPHHKVCGEFLSAEAQGLIAYLGLDLAALGATSVGSFRLATAERQAEAPLPFRCAGLSRYRLDQALLQAAEKAGAVIERGVTVSQMEPTEGHVALRAGSRKFTARAVALATGKHALHQFPRPTSHMVGFKLQLRLTPGALTDLENVVQLVMFNGGYVGALIVEDRLVTLCWVLHEALLKRIRADWPSQAAYFAQSPSSSVNFCTARNHAGTSPSPSPPFPMATFAPTRSQRTSCPSAISSPSSPPSPATARRSRSTPVSLRPKRFWRGKVLSASSAALPIDCDRNSALHRASISCSTAPFCMDLRCGSVPPFPASSPGSRNRPGLRVSTM